MNLLQVGRVMSFSEDESSPKNKQQKIFSEIEKKDYLLRQLDNQLKHLDQVDENYKSEGDPCQLDPAIQRLQMILRQSKKLENKEFQKLCRLAIGKRILNIQVKKKTVEYTRKLKKKENLQQTFRQNRIKRFDYSSLIQQKLQEQTLVVKAYGNGKGFLQSDIMYQQKYNEALIQCNFLENIRKINKLIYSNYGQSKRNSAPLTEKLFNTVWIMMIVLTCLCITLPFISFQNEEASLLIFFAIMLIITSYASVKSYLNKPNNNNQLQQSIEDVKLYLELINREHDKKGEGIEWTCPSGFMYLQVIFHNGFPL